MKLIMMDLHKILNYLIEKGSHGLVHAEQRENPPTLSHDEHKKNNRGDNKNNR